MTDIDRQKDELESLKSIYFDNEFQVLKTNVGENFIAKFFADTFVPNTFLIKCLSTLTMDEPVQFSVRYLPLVELNMELPPDYPSHSPPFFKLHCSWLMKFDVSKLCRKLDELWLVNPTEEILFSWCEFLKRDLLSFLDYHLQLDVSLLQSLHVSFLNLCKERNQSALMIKEIIGTSESFQSKSNTDVEILKDILKKGLSLSKNWKTEDTELDDRAVVSLSKYSSVGKFLRAYAKEREYMQFLKTIYDCSICYSSKLGKECTKFTGCDHVFCVACVSMYFTIKINDGNVQTITCPEDGCKFAATHWQIKELVSESLFSKYDLMLLKTTLESMGDTVYCPRVICQYPCTLNRRDKLTICPYCDYSFCSYCRMVYHGVEQCRMRSDERQKIVSAYQAADAKNKIKMETQYGKKQLHTLIDTYLSETWVTENSQHCPQCNAPIQKFHGCNKMNCNRCGTYFCWLCLSRLNSANPYAHFSDPTSKCANQLFHLVDMNEEDLEWEEWDVEQENDLNDLEELERYSTGSDTELDDDDDDFFELVNNLLPRGPYGPRVNALRLIDEEDLGRDSPLPPRIMAGHAEDDLVHAGGDADHTGDDKDQTSGESNLTGDDKDRIGGETDYTEDDVVHAGGDADHTGDDKDQTSGESNLTGDVKDRIGGETDHTEDDVVHADGEQII